MTQMRLRYDALQQPKPGSSDDQCEDAFAYDGTSSRAAVCDGASTAFESRRWARLLARKFIESAPFGFSDEEFLGWVDSVAEQWAQSIPWETLDVFEEIKADSGSAATLIGLQLTPHPQQEAAGTWRCLAVGDSCLFQVRGGRLVVALPIRRSADFNVTPPLLSTKRESNLRNIGKVVTETGTWQEGDCFFLLTDAMAQWFLRVSEQHGAPWDDLIALNQPRFRVLVRETQARRLMRQDDATALMIGVGVPLGTRDTPVPPPVPLGRPSECLSAEAAEYPVDEAARQPTGPSAAGRPQPSKERVSRLPHPRTPPGPRRTGRPSRDARSRRRRVAFIASAGLILAMGIAIVVNTVGSSPPAAPTATVLTAQAQRFARDLTTYSDGSAHAYEKYRSVLLESVKDRNGDVVARLVGLDHAPPGPFSSRPGHVSVKVEHADQSQAQLYVLVGQAIRTAGNESSRRLLIDLTMVRQGQKWLVSDARMSLVSPLSGALVPTGAPNGTAR